MDGWVSGVEWSGGCGGLVEGEERGMGRRAVGVGGVRNLRGVCGFLWMCFWLR